MKTGIIIQARKGSTRLPNKMVLPFDGDKNVLEILLDKLKEYYPSYPIILATTTAPQDDELAEIARNKKLFVFRGDKKNVLSRFVEAGEKYQLDNIIRVCADNPFLDMPHIQELIDLIEQGEADYVSYQNQDGLPVIKTHLGLFTEAVKLKSLKRIQKDTDEPQYFEHVTNYIYENSEEFKVSLINLPNYFKQTKNIRLTLDTASDFEMEKSLYKKYEHLNTRELIERIKQDKYLLKKMKREIEKNQK